MMKDGDLWELCAKVVEQRGAYTTRISKVKAHATDEMIAEAKVERAQKKGMGRYSSRKGSKWKSENNPRLGRNVH